VVHHDGPELPRPVTGGGGRQTIPIAHEHAVTRATRSAIHTGLVPVPTAVEQDRAEEPDLFD